MMRSLIVVIFLTFISSIAAAKVANVEIGKGGMELRLDANLGYQLTRFHIFGSGNSGLNSGLIHSGNAILLWRLDEQTRVGVRLNGYYGKGTGTYNTTGCDFSPAGGDCHPERAKSGTLEGSIAGGNISLVAYADKYFWVGAGLGATKEFSIYMDGKKAHDIALWSWGLPEAIFISGLYYPLNQYMSLTSTLELGTNLLAYSRLAGYAGVACSF